MDLDKDQKGLILLLLEKLNFHENIASKYLRKLTTNNISHSGFEVSIKFTDMLVELYDEIELKARPYGIALKSSRNSDYFTATDVSNYIFCPASFSIARTFDIYRLKNRAVIDHGTELHERRLLLRFTNDDLALSNSSIPTRSKNGLQKISRCRNIYSGHKADSALFTNDLVKFAGKPDYIYRDPHQRYFVIEEKFQMDGSRSFDNHSAQLESYVKFIKDYDLSYGVLLNWEVERRYIDDRVIVEAKDCKIKVIQPNSPDSQLDPTVDSIRTMQLLESVPFDVSKLNPNKCASCSVRHHCGHKSGRYNILSFPYSTEFWQLKPENLSPRIADLNLEFLTKKD